MGVIQRQSIKQSLVNYFAVAIAAIGTVFIYPLDKDSYGLARFIIDTSMMLAPFIMLGFGGVSIRFFPYFKDEKRGHRGFLPFLLLAILVSSLIFIGIAFMLKDQFYNIYSEKPPIYRQFLPYLLPIGILVAFFNLFFTYSGNFKRIAIPAVFQNLIKISLPLLILLYVWHSISIEQVINGILLNYILALLGIIIYIYWLGQLKLKLDFSLFSKDRIKEIRKFALYNLFGSLGAVLAFRIDSFMISTLVDFGSNGAFAIAAFIANVIAIPTNAVNQISGPIITEAIKNDDLTQVKKLYQNTSINLLVIGLLLFVCIAASIADLISIMPKNEELQGAVVIVLLIGAAKVIDMGTSINNQIISYSKYYRFGFYAILLMAVFNIIANLILIPEYKIIGAAVATLLSIGIYNLAKMIFIQWRFKMQPFTMKTLWILLISLAVYVIGVLIPSTEMAILDILIKSLVIGVVYISAVLYFGISPEFENLLNNAAEKIRRYFK